MLSSQNNNSILTHKQSELFTLSKFRFPIFVSWQAVKNPLMDFECIDTWGVVRLRYLYVNNNIIDGVVVYLFINMAWSLSRVEERLMSLQD